VKLILAFEEKFNVIKNFYNNTKKTLKNKKPTPKSRLLHITDVFRR